MPTRAEVIAAGAERIERGQSNVTEEDGSALVCGGAGGRAHDDRCSVLLPEGARKLMHPTGFVWTASDGRTLAPTARGATEGKFVGEVHFWLADPAGHFLGDYDGWGELEPAEVLATRIPAVADCAACGPGQTLRILDKATNPRPANRPPTAEEIEMQRKRDRLVALRARAWSALTLLEQEEATDLAFQLGETVPAITATA